MTSMLDTRLLALDADGACAAFSRIRRGIEKESLRVTLTGDLAQTPHPVALGSALMHPSITTDFSESQLELITGVHESIAGCLDELQSIHAFVYRNIGDEMLWTSSMPCSLGYDRQVQVGRYGDSNLGRAKTIYRLGLGHRYGRLMQTISGIHYNFSLPDELWPVIAARDGVPNTQEYRTRAYFDLIRNFRRHSWLLIYLFGASPAICKSFVRDKPHPLETFDEGSLYLPYATSLRMGGLGYQSDAQAKLHVSYNSLDEYANTLHRALTEPYPEYEKIGVQVNGEYRQLSTALLQIENEFYGTIRPKRPVEHGERPIVALEQRGVEYVEVRCLDLNPFLPVGIDEETIRLIDIFLLHCLWSESPDDSPAESAEMRDNQRRVVEGGRRPELQLTRHGASILMRAWGEALLDECVEIAARLDRCHGGQRYRQTLAMARQRLSHPELTPSARVIDAMQSRREPFSRFALERSTDTRAHFLRYPLAQTALDRFAERSRRSIAEQQALEREPHPSFETFLARYLELPAPPAHR